MPLEEAAPRGMVLIEAERRLRGERQDDDG
jgi:hypothetical protein